MVFNKHMVILVHLKICMQSVRIKCIIFKIDTIFIFSIIIKNDTLYVQVSYLELIRITAYGIIHI